MHSDVTIVIPIFQLDQYRTRNLDFILSRLISTSKRIVLIEQSTTGDPMYASIKHSNIEHLVFRSPHDKIRKSWLINTSMNFIKTTHIWVCDTDFYIEYNKLNINNVLAHDFIQPYHYAKDLDELQTQSLVNNGNIEVNYYSGEEESYRHINTFGALSFIANISKFQSIGGMCEQYEGWGYEDFDLYLRVHLNTTGPQIYIVDNILGVHMYHPPSLTKPGDVTNNLKIFTEKGFNIDQIDDITLKYYYTDWGLVKK